MLKRLKITHLFSAECPDVEGVRIEFSVSTNKTEVKYFPKRLFQIGLVSRPVNRRAGVYPSAGRNHI